MLQQRPSLTFLGNDRAKALARMGFRNLRDLLDYEPLRSARTLAAASQGLISRPSLEPFVKRAFTSEDAAQAVSWSVTALHITDSEAQALFQAGVKTIGDLAQLGKEADEAVLAAQADNGFRERPSAPAQLLPGMIGSVASSVRYTTFIRDTELRNLTFKVHEDCMIPLPISSPLKEPGSLADIFETQRCPVLHLGYMCDHRQRWINVGTHLGEVTHSVSLAPGESRNIALVNWHRRQLTALEEQTRTREDLSMTFVQNRALEEITSAVAKEHQSGGTQTEANTFSTAVGIVGTIGVSAGIGAAIGTAITPGVGTAIGAVAGGVAGAVAGGAVFSGSETLGTIEADTEGNREIVAEVQQRISLTTSQAASAVRSLWSTVVVEDVQAESVQATTSNITNYKHMHALNIEYYEVLQHYLTRIEVERVQPIVFVPFTFLDFTRFRFIRDYWDAVRPYIEDVGLQAQGDSYFVTEGEPERPDLLPVPPVPRPPGRVDLVLEDLIVEVLYNNGFLSSTDIGLSLMLGSNEILPDNTEPDRVPDSRLGQYDYGSRYTFPTRIENAERISEVILSISQFNDEDVPFTIRVVRGRLRSGGRTLTNLNGVIIAQNGRITRSTFVEDNVRTSLPWTPAAGVESGNATETREYTQALKERAKIIVINNYRQNAFEALVENIERFKQRLERLILRRRHFFTRVLLNAIEPEEIIQLLESLRIGHTEADPNFGIPLSEIAHTIPLGMTPGAFVLKLKRLDRNKLEQLARRYGDIKFLLELIEYSDNTLTFFSDAKERGVLAQTDHVYAPTGGLFAEAVLGRSNSAEYLDMERYFNWKDSPIPHQPPAISAVSTDSRFQQGNVSVNVPEGNLQVINPVSFPDPTGLQGVLTAIQNPNTFRDMSNASALADIIGSLTTLAGQMGQAASTMTGEAAQQAMQSAAEASKLATELAKTQMVQSSNPTGAAANSLTGIGASLNQASKIDDQRPNTPTNSGSNRDSSTGEDILRKFTGTEATTKFASNLPTPLDTVSEQPKDIDIKSSKADALAKVAQYDSIIAQPDSIAAVSPWRIDRKLMYDRLKSLIDDPNLVKQDGLGLCGPAAFLTLWLKRDPLAVAEFAVELYETGKSSINEYLVEPDKDSLISEDYNALKNTNVDFTPEADWMIMGSLRDTENLWLDYNGKPDNVDSLAGITLPSALANWLEATNIYSVTRDETIRNETNVFLTKGIDHAMSLKYSPKRDIILLINASMIGAASSSPRFLFDRVPNHYIILTSDIIRETDGSITFRYWSWGKEFTKYEECNFKEAVFESNYYGAVIAEGRAEN
jgi:hypothetical protein